MAAGDLAAPVDLHGLLHEAVGLKHLTRAGWLRVGVPAPESVAAHSFGVALAALLRCPPELDRGRVLAMALLHDLAEVRVGDITPHDGVPRAEKKRRERAAISGLLASQPELVALWEECEAAETAEARFVHAMDQLDLGLTARFYDAAGHPVAELLAVGARALAELDGAEADAPRR